MEKYLLNKYSAEVPEVNSASTKASLEPQALEASASVISTVSEKKEDLEVPEDSTKTDQNKKKYHNISNDMRMKLIDAVNVKGEKIKHAANRLDINYSSAKSICQVFKQEGRMKKKTYKDRSNHQFDLSMSYMDSQDDQPENSKQNVQTDSADSAVGVNSAEEPALQKRLHSNPQFTPPTPVGLQRPEFIQVPQMYPFVRNANTGLFNPVPVVMNPMYGEDVKGSLPKQQMTAPMVTYNPNSNMQYPQIAQGPQGPVIFMSINSSNGMNGLQASTQFNFGNPPVQQVCANYGQFNGCQMMYPSYGMMNGYSQAMHPAQPILNYGAQTQQPMMYYMPVMNPSVQYVPQNMYACPTPTINPITSKQLSAKNYYDQQYVKNDELVNTTDSEKMNDDRR